MSADEKLDEEEEGLMRSLAKLFGGALVGGNSETTLETHLRFSASSFHILANKLVLVLQGSGFYVWIIQMLR